MYSSTRGKQRIFHVKLCWRSMKKSVNNCSEAKKIKLAYKSSLVFTWIFYTHTQLSLIYPLIYSYLFVWKLSRLSDVNQLHIRPWHSWLVNKFLLYFTQTNCNIKKIIHGKRQCQIICLLIVVYFFILVLNISTSIYILVCFSNFRKYKV